MSDPHEFDLEDIDPDWRDHFATRELAEAFYRREPKQDTTE